MNILLVEDSPVDAKILIKALASKHEEKWNLHHVLRLDEALEVCRHSPFDIALLDLSLPDSDGWKTVDTFHQEQPDIPITVVTSSNDDNIAIQVLAKGAQDYLIKSYISGEELTRSIRYSLERGKIIKKLQESERELQEKNEQLQAFLLAFPGIIVWIDKNLCYSSVNKDFANILQLFPEQIVHKPIEFGNSCSQFSDFIKAFMKSADLKAHQVISFEVNSQIFYYLMVAQKYNNQTCLVVGIDITEQEKAEKKAKENWQKEQELSQMKNNLLLMFSHDFKNPLTNILMCTDFLQKLNRVKELHPQSYFCLQAMETSVRQMVSLLDEILLINRAESGQLTYEPTPINLENFCRNLCDLIYLEENHRCVLDLQITSPPLDVELDEVLLGHVLRNLLDNAIKYSPDGGKVQFCCTSENNLVTFEIKDSGMGIPQREQEKLFEVFYRGSNVGEIRGTGLGLSIVRHCVALLQGEIELYSREGMGTSFRIKLPVKVLSPPLKK